jgi:peptide/nickel transport system ATP-binding protein/oligopeptide transport system ATP-binding protein
MTAPLLDVRDLRVTFRGARGTVHAVDGLSLTVAAGEVLGLVGESGSGKSVSLRAITRLLHAGSEVTGQALWRGADLLTMDEPTLRHVRGAQVAMVFQEPMSALNPVLSIGRQIEEVLAAHTDLDQRARSARAEELLGLVGIAAARTRLAQYPHEFSGGMRQRAMIAIAIAAGPAMLLADEPTTALDVTIQDQILKLLLRLVDDLGMGMVLVTHDLGVVAETCDRVAVMYAGRLCETGRTADVFATPRHAYTHALLGSMPGTGAARAMLTPIPGQPPRIDRPLPGCAFAPRCAMAEPRCTTERPPMTGDPRTSTGHASACFAADRLPTLVSA